MTDKERYQRTFSAVHASGDYLKEVKSMKNTKKFKFTKLIAACIVIALLAAISTVAYAANIGNIQNKIQIWRNGAETDAVLEITNPGEYVLKYTDENGKEHSQIGGGVAVGLFGKERPLTEEELLMDLNVPEAIYEDDGTVKVCWYDQSVDITDKFEDGVCHVILKCGKETMYVTVRYGEGLSCSSDKFVD